MKRPHVRLAIVANGDAKALQRSVDSVRAIIDSALVVIAPRAFASLPEDGFGYCSLETRVVQSPVLASLTRTALLRLAEEDFFVDWVVSMRVGAELTSPPARVDDFFLAEGLDHRNLGGAWLTRARRGYAFTDESL